jgi:hypothetical protein
LSADILQSGARLTAVGTDVLGGEWPN